MFFIGSGALLYNAVRHGLAAGLPVDGICCPPGDACAPRLRKQGVGVIESTDPNLDGSEIADSCRDGIVFSINNKHLIGDELLCRGLTLYNIHNGLVQRYRGIAEVCIFAALCRGEGHYGVTLQQVLPGQKVDAGPVVEQIRFDIGPDDNFSAVLQKSLDACQRIFEAQLQDILSRSAGTIAVETTGKALSYKDVVSLGLAADPASLARASDLGRYAGFFPRLRDLIALIPQPGRRCAPAQPVRPALA